MRVLITLLFTLGLAFQAVAQQDPEREVDRNTAFYEGNRLSYVIPAPEGFAMNTDFAVEDGYSFAFLPDGEPYDSASILIGVNIFSIENAKSFSLSELISSDTSAIRSHYGTDISIEETAPIETRDHHTLRTVYLSNETGFIPNVMMSYLYEGDDVLVFELSVAESYPRFLAERTYTDCLAGIKVLVNGELSQKLNRKQ